MLPVPVYGVSWPRGSGPSSEWPASLQQLARLLFDEVCAVQPAGPYYFAGHSFGATLCLEIAHTAEAAGEQVAVCALLDPRNIPPVATDLAKAFHDAGLAESLALLVQSSAEGSRYADQLDRALQVEPSERDACIRKELGSAALAALEHVHETSTWYAGLIASAGSRSEDERPQLSRRPVLLRAAESWRQAPSSSETPAEASSRQFQVAVFQDNAQVAEHLAMWSGHQALKGPLIPGGHFGILQEPHVSKTAMHLCHACVEAGAATEEEQL